MVKNSFHGRSRSKGASNRKVGILEDEKKVKVCFFLNFRDSNFMISRPDARNSIIKLDLCAPFRARFLMLPALRGPQIVKLELGGHKIAFMAVPALRGPQIVKLELAP